MVNPLRSLALVALASACATPGWDGESERWGTLRSVLRDGEKQGRVEIVSVATRDAVGLGALVGLEGEVLVREGEAWTSRAASGALRTERAAAGEEAAFLVLARVPAWRELVLEERIRADALQPLALGAPDADAVPFVVEGELEELERIVAHVDAAVLPRGARVRVPARRGPPRAQVSACATE